MLIKSAAIVFNQIKSSGLIGKQLNQNLNFTRCESTSQELSKKLLDRVAIVTGSSDGIGFAIAKRMAEDGAKVVISSRKKDKVDEALKELQKSFPKQVVGTVCHVGHEKDRDHLIEFTLDKFGSIDILVSNVAVNPYFGSFMDMEESQWDKIFDINVKAPFLLSKKVVPHMMKNNRKNAYGGHDKGAIVYISSIGAYTGMSSIGAYSVSKTALLGLCKNMSMELAQDGIRANLVAPGVIKTKFSEALWTSSAHDEWFSATTHLKRIGYSDEISGIVSFLCSPEASYITGENITVAGGYHCSL